MKRSFSSCSFGLSSSQDIPFTSPTLSTTFLAYHSSDSSNQISANHYNQTVYNYLAPHHHESRVEEESIGGDDGRAPFGDIAHPHPHELVEQKEHYQLPLSSSFNDSNGLDHNASADDAQLQNHQYLQTDWSYQDACSNYRDSLGMQQHQIKLMGAYCPNIFGDMSLDAPDASCNSNLHHHPSFSEVAPAFQIYSGVSPGSYLGNARYIADGNDIATTIAPAAERSQSNSPLDLEMIEYELGISHHASFHNHQYCQPAPINDKAAYSFNGNGDQQLYPAEKKKKKKGPTATATIAPAGLPQTSSKVVKKTTKQGNKPSKHVGKACTHCKKAHLACDNARPCKRCVHMGKDDCVDVEHKRRGRPRSSPEKCHAHLRGPSSAAAALMSIVGVINPSDMMDMPAEAA